MKLVVAEREALLANEKEVDMYKKKQRLLAEQIQEVTLQRMNKNSSINQYMMHKKTKKVKEKS